MHAKIAKKSSKLNSYIKEHPKELEKEKSNSKNPGSCDPNFYYMIKH